MNTVISFSCPAHLALRLSEENIPSRKKSEWISEAIKNKLDGGVGLVSKNIPTRTLIAALYDRYDIDQHLKEELLRRLNQPKN